jgi:eukaryotic-like serine/threonine-protein kinase
MADNDLDQCHDDRPVRDAQTRTWEPSNPANTSEFLLMIGEVFAERYEIQRELGRGRFGEVYSAFDRGPLQRSVALKIIRSTPGGSPERSASAQQRFLNEARVAGRLSHSNIATIFDVGEAAGCVYMTQELVPGRDLKKLLSASNPLPLRRVIAITKHICECLAHARGCRAS